MQEAKHPRCPKGHRTRKLNLIVQKGHKEKQGAWVCIKCKIIYTNPKFGNLTAVSMDLSLPYNATMDGKAFTSKEDRQKAMGMIKN